MPATLGKLRQYQLNGVADTSPSTFQLPNDLASYAPNTVTNNPKQLKKLHRQGFSRGELAAMGQIVANYSDDFSIGAEYSTRPGALDMDGEYAIVDAEFLFHGSPSDWDTIYQSGGLKSAGDNTALGQHVHSSSTAASCYVSGTRILSAAKSFAKTEDGWIYLLYARQGIGVFVNPTHKQAEVAAIDKVATNDIMMFKQFKKPNLIYVNQEFHASLLTQNLERGFRLLGGGQYGQGQFWNLLS